MIKSKNSRISLSTKRHRLNLFKDVDTMSNLEIEGEKIRSSFVYKGQNIFLPSDTRAKRIIDVENELYVFCTNLYLYKPNNGVLEKVSDNRFGGDMHIFKVDSDGERKLLVVSQDRQWLIGEEEVRVNVPYGKYMLIYKGMLFSANENVLRFSKEYDYTNFSLDFGLGGYLKMDDFEGNVYGLNVINDKLYVFLRHKILVLSPFGSPTDFTFQTVETDYLDIVDNTVKGFDQIVYFVNGNKLCSFDGKVVKEVKSFLDNDGITPIGPAYVFEDKYLLSVMVNGYVKAHIYYLSADQKIHGITLADKAVSAKGGYAVYLSTGEITKLSKPTEDVNYYFKSKKIDFNNLHVKSLMQFNLYSSAKSCLKINGRFGTSSFTLSKGHNLGRCARESEEFVFELVGTGKDLEFYGFDFIYAKRGN